MVDRTSLLVRQSVGASRLTKAIYDGDIKQGIYFAGQVIGACDDIPTVSELIDRIMKEAEETVKNNYAAIS